jgi:hypothetical protein
MFKTSALRKKSQANRLSAKIPRLKADNKKLAYGIDTKPNTFLNNLLLQDLINQQGIFQRVLQVMKPSGRRQIRHVNPCMNTKRAMKQLP